MLRAGRTPLSTSLVLSIAQDRLSTLRASPLHFIFEKFHHHATVRTGFFKDGVKAPFLRVIPRTSSHYNALYFCAYLNRAIFDLASYETSDD